MYYVALGTRRLLSWYPEGSGNIGTIHLKN